MKITTNLNPVIHFRPSFIIITAGFEDRCLSIKDILKDISLTKVKVLLFYYPKQSDAVDNANREKEEELDLFFTEKGCDIIRLKLNHLNPIETFHDFRKLLIKMNDHEKKNILVDISSMIDGILTLIIDLLFDQIFESLNFIYTLPESYNLVDALNNNNTNIEDIKLNKLYKMTIGIKEIKPFEGFEGTPDPTRLNVLIFLAGFERNKIFAILERYEDSSVFKRIILYGRSNFIDNTRELDLSIKVHQDLKTRYDLIDNFIEIHDIQLIIEQLSKIIDQYLDYNIVVCCTGTKLQTLATTMVARNYPKVTLLRVLMSGYNPDFFSKGQGDSFLVTITNTD